MAEFVSACGRPEAEVQAAAAARIVSSKLPATSIIGNGYVGGRRAEPSP